MESLIINNSVIPNEACERSEQGLGGIFIRQ
jgi:hypothetical protein